MPTSEGLWCGRMGSMPVRSSKVDDGRRRERRRREEETNGQDAECLSSRQSRDAAGGAGSRRMVDDRFYSLNHVFHSSITCHSQLLGSVIISSLVKSEGASWNKPRHRFASAHVNLWVCAVTANASDTFSRRCVDDSYSFLTRSPDCISTQRSGQCNF